MLQEMKRLASTQNPKLKPVGSVVSLLQHQLFACGLDEELAIEVCNILTTSPALSVMAGRWCDPVAAYPKQMIAVMWFSAQRETVAFLKKNHPMHWALGILDGPSVPIYITASETPSVT